MRMNLKFIPNATALVRDRLKKSPFALTVTALILRGWKGMADTLKFKVHKADLMTADHVKIDSEAKEIIRQAQKATGLPARTIVSKMIKYCADKWEVEEV